MLEQCGPNLAEIDTTGVVAGQRLVQAFSVHMPTLHSMPLFNTNHSASSEDWDYPLYGTLAGRKLARWMREWPGCWCRMSIRLTRCSSESSPHLMKHGHHSTLPAVFSQERHTPLSIYSSTSTGSAPFHG